MSLQDKLTVDWKGKIVNYQGLKLYVVDQFDYKEETYLYVMDTNLSDYMIKIMFLKKKADNIFAHVDEKSELYKELITIAAGRVTVNQLENLAKDLSK